MFPLLLIVIGILVLVIGKRLAVLGAAVGALLGVGLLSLLSPSGGLLIQLLLVGGLAVIGFFVAGFAKGIINIVVLVLGALGGAAIVLAFLDLFHVDAGLMRWLLAVVGGVVGLILIRRARKGSPGLGDHHPGRAGRRAARHARVHHLAAGPAGHQRHADRHRAGGRRYRVPGRNLRQAQSGCASAADSAGATCGGKLTDG